MLEGEKLNSVCILCEILGTFGLIIISPMVFWDTY